MRKLFIRQEISLQSQSEKEIDSGIEKKKEEE